ncbi:MAG: PKD domain-containing protein [Acidobacteriota bacterium]
MRFSRVLVLCLALFLHAALAWAAGPRVEAEPEPRMEPEVLYLESAGALGWLEVSGVSGPISWSIDDPSFALLEAGSGGQAALIGQADVGLATVTASFEGGSLEATVVISHALELEYESTLLAGHGTERALGARVYDAAGPASISWEVEEPGTVILSPLSGGDMSVTASVATGSTAVTARYRDLVASTEVVIAQPVSSAIAIPGAWIKWDRTDLPAGWVALDAAVVSTGIDYGSLVFARDIVAGRPGLLARVVNAGQEPGGDVLIEIEPVAIEEVFETYSISVEGSAGPLTESRKRPGRTLDVALRNENEWECELDNSEASVDIVPFTIEGELFSITPKVVLDVDWSGVERFEILYGTATNVALIGPSITFDASGGVEFTCSRELATIPLGELPPAAPFRFTPELATEVGVTGELIANAGELTVSTFTLSYDAEGNYGWIYDRVTGWERVKEHHSGEPEVDGLDMEDDGFEISFDAKLEPYVSGTIGLGIDLFAVDLASLNVVTGTFGIEGSLELPAATLIYSDPLPNEHYRNPTWNVDAGLDIALDVGLEWSDTIEVIFRSPNNPPSVDLTIYHYGGSIGSTPGGTLDNEENAIPLGASTKFDLDLAPFGLLEKAVYQGRDVDLWAVADDGTRVDVESSSIDGNGEASFAWTPSEAGEYAMTALVYDRLFGAMGLPMAVGGGDFHVAEATVELEANPDSGGAPLPVNLSWEVDVPGNRAVTCRLDPGDDSPIVHLGNCEGEAAYTHTYGSNGYFTASLTVTAGDWSQTATTPVTLGYYLVPAQGITFLGDTGTNESSWGQCTVTGGDSFTCNGEIIPDGPGHSTLKVNFDVAWPSAAHNQPVGMVMTVQNAWASQYHSGVQLRLTASNLDSAWRYTGQSFLGYDRNHTSLANWPYTQTKAIPRFHQLTNRLQLRKQHPHYLNDIEVQWVITDVAWVIPY